MRKLIIANIISLDGYVAGPGGDVMALPMATGSSTSTTWSGNGRLTPYCSAPPSTSG
jgi:hypothetical protein